VNNLREMIGNAIQRAGKKQADLTETGVVGSAQAANRKMKTSVWSVDELVTVANWLGCKVLFQFQDGEQREIKAIFEKKLRGKKETKNEIGEAMERDDKNDSR